MLVVVLSGLASPLNLGSSFKQASFPLLPFNSALGSSWNTAVTCQPLIVTVRDILGSQENSNGGATFEGGWNESIPDKRSINPPCSVNGKATFVQIDNVILPSLTLADECGDSGYSPQIPTAFCDSTGNIEDPNDHTFDPNYNMIQIHTENDMNWKYNSIAYPDAPVGVPIDIQGFVNWDPWHLADSWHSYSGWELHPLTAWRLSGAQPLTASIIFSPTSPVVNTNTYFVAAATGGTAPYTYKWSFGDGSTGTSAAPIHQYGTSGVYTVSLTVTDSASGSYSTSRSVTISLPAPLNAGYQFLPSTPLAGTTVTFTGSAIGGQPPYSYTWVLGDGAVGSGSAPTHSYISPGSYTVTQTVTDSAGNTATVSGGINVLSSSPPPLMTQLAFANPSGLDLSGTISWQVWDGNVPVNTSCPCLLNTTKVYELNVFYQSHPIESRTFSPQSVVYTTVFMYPHRSTPNGYVAFNSTIGNFALIEQLVSRLVFIATATTSEDYTILVKVPTSPISVLKDGAAYPFTYDASYGLVVIQTATLTQWDIVFGTSSQPPPSQPPSDQIGSQCLLCVNTIRTMNFLWLFVFSALAGIVLSLVFMMVAGRRRFGRTRSEYFRQRILR